MSEQSVIGAIMSSRPNFRNYADKIAYAINCVFIVTGYQLNTTGGPAFNDDVLTTPISYAASMDGWDEFEDRYAFVYSTPEYDSSLQKKVVVKCHLAKDNELCVRALRAAASSSSRPVHHHIIINDFVVQSNDTKFTTYYSLYKNLGKLVDCIFKYVLTKLERSSKASTRKEKVISPPYERRSQEEEDENKDEDKEEKEKEEEALEGKFARMRLTNKKRRKKINYASVAKPYKRRSVKNNNNKNSVTAGSKEEHAVTLYDLPYGIYTNMKKAIAVMEHLETHKDDKKAIASLECFEYYIDVLSKYHHLKPVDLPTDWKYDRTKAKDVISQCYWEKLSYFES